jgi:hypothetical protein
LAAHTKPTNTANAMTIKAMIMAVRVCILAGEPSQPQRDQQIGAA